MTVQGTVWEYYELSESDRKQIVLFSNRDLLVLDNIRVRPKGELLYKDEMNTVLEGQWKVHAFNMFFTYDGETQWIKYDRENNELTLDGLTYRLKSKIDPERDRKT